ncbi:MAG: TonB-dependent receptor [Candidatus Zixiibacteriota bacterium]
MIPTGFGRWVRSAMLPLLAVLLAMPAMAATTGKIAGVVIDKKTKEPLIQAPVSVVGTTIGALTDIDGKFQILAVPAGVHQLECKLVGYTSVMVNNVVVNPDQTTTLSFELEPSLIDMPTIVVERVAELIKMDEATTKRDVSAEKIKSMPVSTVADILKTQVGVTIRNDRFHIRGGRAEEVLYTVDGVSMKDPLGGRGPTENLNLSGTEIENVSIIKGGWSAEYGEATSGIINVATKEGDQEDTHGHIEYFTDNLGTANLNKYSFNYNRLEFTLGGPEPFLTKRLLPALGLGAMSNKLTYFINADFDRTDSYTPINRYTTASNPLDFRNFKFAGMVMQDRQENVGNLGLKMTYRVSPDIRMTGIVKRSYERSLLFDWNYRYVPNNMPWIEDKNDRYSMTWTHTLSPSTFYQVIVSRYERTYQQKPGDPDTPGGTLNPDQFPLSGIETDHYVDVDNNGNYDAPEDFIDVYPDGIYTPADVWTDVNGDGEFQPDIDILQFDFNQNGLADDVGGEPFADRNDNGRWDAGDVLESDGNGNGKYDPELERDSYGPTSNDIPESFIDGDRSLGEPYEDLNRNGVWDDNYEHPLGGRGEPFVDLSGDSRYQGPDDQWVPGVPYEDLNGNSVFDQGAGAPSGSWSTIDNDYDVGEPFNDKNGNGIRDGGDGFYDRGWDEIALWHRRVVKTSSVDIDLTSQLRREHEVKAGFKYSAHDLALGELQQPYIPYTGTAVDDGPYQGRGDLRDFYNQTPKAGAFYLRDKMEYGQLIANLGLRYDYFIQSDNAEITDTTIFGDFGNQLVSQDYRDKFAPRIAFSYPISDKAKVFFNYGHFYQLPQLTFMYRRSTQVNSQDGIIGNVNLDYQKTIQYEFGVQYLLSPEYVLSVQGFYKDDFGRIGATEIQGVGQETRNFYENRDYARSRGLELELEKKYGNYVSGTATYNFSYSFGKASANSLAFFENFYSAAGAVTIQEFPLDWDRRHVVTLILDLRVPQGDHPKLWGLTMPDNFGLNIFWQFGTGFPYTPGSSHPGAEILQGNIVAENSERFPATSNVDIRFNKDFRFTRMSYTFEVWINNLFDTRNVDLVGSNTGRPDTELNLGGIPYANPAEPVTPRAWQEGRQIRFGLGMNF